MSLYNNKYYVFFGHGFETDFLKPIDMNLYPNMEIIMLETEGCKLVEFLDKSAKSPTKLKNTSLQGYLQYLHGTDYGNPFCLYSETLAPNLILSTCSTRKEIIGLFELGSEKELPIKKDLGEFFKLSDLIDYLIELNNNSNFILELYNCRENLLQGIDQYHCYPYFSDYLNSKKIKSTQAKVLPNYPCENLEKWYNQKYGSKLMLPKKIRKKITNIKSLEESVGDRITKIVSRVYNNVRDLLKNRYGKNIFVNRSMIITEVQNLLSKEANIHDDFLIDNLTNTIFERYNKEKLLTSGKKIKK